jgi:uncharacterized membrane protein
MTDHHPRLPWIDALRGLAIMLMIPANYAAYLAGPHALEFRVGSSFAAPIFVMVSAGLAVLTADRHDFRYALQRGGAIVLIAMGVDVLVWRILPWTSFDILYLIGAALPLAYLLRHAPALRLIALAAAIFLISGLLRDLVGYHADVLQVMLAEPELPSASRVLKSWLLDGWFPMLPWLAFPMLGLAYFRMLFQHSGSVGTAVHALAGCAVALVGILLLLLPVDASRFANVANGGVLAIRHGYSEVFYPATPAFAAAAVGVAMMATAVLNGLGTGPLVAGLAFFGRYSMLVYVLHLLIGRYAIEPTLYALGRQAFDSALSFSMVNLIVIGAVAGTCLAVQRVKRRHPPQSLLLQVLIGR